MNSGDLDRRIVVESFQETRDDWNYPVRTWVTFHTCWAQKRDDLETEPTELDQEVGVTRTLWKVRYRAGIDTAMRIAYNSRYYYITGIKELGRQEGMHITTELRD